MRYVHSDEYLEELYVRQISGEDARPGHIAFMNNGEISRGLSFSLPSFSGYFAWLDRHRCEYFDLGGITGRYPLAKHRWWVSRAGQHYIKLFNILLVVLAVVGILANPSLWPLWLAVAVLVIPALCLGWRLSSHIQFLREKAWFDANSKRLLRLALDAPPMRIVYSARDFIDVDYSCPSDLDTSSFHRAAQDIFKQWMTLPTPTKEGELAQYSDILDVRVRELAAEHQRRVVAYDEFENAMYQIITDLHVAKSAHTRTKSESQLLAAKQGQLEKRDR